MRLNNNRTITLSSADFSASFFGKTVKKNTTRARQLGFGILLLVLNTIFIAHHLELGLHDISALSTEKKLTIVTPAYEESFKQKNIALLQDLRMKNLRRGLALDTFRPSVAREAKIRQSLFSYKTGKGEKLPHNDWFLSKKTPKGVTAPMQLISKTRDKNPVLHLYGW
jgi:hypothetical protein